MKAALAELAAMGMARADDSAGIVWLPNALKYATIDGPNAVKGWGQRWWPAIPECGLKAEITRHFRDNLDAPYRDVLTDALGLTCGASSGTGSKATTGRGGKTGSRAASGTPSGTGSGSQEQEQEREQEMEQAPPQPPPGAPDGARAEPVRSPGGGGVKPGASVPPGTHPMLAATMPGPASDYKPDPARNTVADHPGLKPVAESIVEEYVARIQSPHALTGGEAAVVALLASGVPEADLRRSIGGYLAHCKKHDKHGGSRCGPAGFFGGEWKRHRSGPARESRPAREPDASEIRPDQERCSPEELARDAARLLRRKPKDAPEEAARDE